MIIKGILEFLAKDNRWAILLVLVLVVVGGITMKAKNNKINELNDKYVSEVKLKNALTDSVTTYMTKEGEWKSEKLTLQSTIKGLEDDNLTLTESQKDLLAKIRKVEEHNTVISAALIDAEVLIDSLLHSGLVVVDTTNKTVNFIELNDSSIQYDMTAIGVLPFPINTKPQLMIKKLTLPNKQFIEFHWENDKKIGYPVSFSVTNSNPYVIINNIDSYIIPEINKEKLDPTGWAKFDQWLTKNAKIVGFVAGGVVVGAGGTYLMMK